jgi:hypothetical protein
VSTNNTIWQDAQDIAIGINAVVCNGMGFLTLCCHQCHVEVVHLAASDVMHKSLLDARALPVETAADNMAIVEMAYMFYMADLAEWVSVKLPEAPHEVPAGALDRVRESVPFVSEFVHKYVEDQEVQNCGQKFRLAWDVWSTHV